MKKILIVNVALIFVYLIGGILVWTPVAAKDVQFVPNTFKFWDNPRFWTTMDGPAYADIVLDNQNNFLPCEGGPIALCYYSGPEPATCELSDDGRIANCECYEIPYGPYFVDINSILNYGVYLKTVRKCNVDGSGCQEVTNSAPVCEAINNGKLIPGADMISTFSFACVPGEGIGLTNCPADPTQTALYAGCMTAPCTKTAEDGIVNCACPTFDGRFQVGNFDAMCTLSEPLVWSAAYSPDEDKNFPVPPIDGCFPDAPGEFGCPLLPEEIPPPPSGVDCTQVCDEYASTANEDNVELGFTCDATLCTAPPTCTIGDPPLVGIACTGLQPNELTEIIKTEEEAQCSCCASQLCRCEPNQATNEAIDKLNAAQKALGIKTQCVLNGTLCGTK